MTIKLPTWKEANKKDDAGTASPLELFISEYEPAGNNDEVFRRMLSDVLSAEEARLTAELEQARPILECLADMKRIYEAAFDDYPRSCPDDGHIHDCLTHGHIRLAAKIVEGIMAGIYER